MGFGEYYFQNIHKMSSYVGVGIQLKAGLLFISHVSYKWSATWTGFQQGRYLPPVGPVVCRWIHPSAAEPT